MDGKFAIASKEIPGGGQSSYREEQAKSPDIRSGFLADTYLANWDVVGLVFDNIMKDANGNMYRVDNGGSLNFRAQGGLKDFLPNDIPELKNMLNPDFSAGQVFAGITEEELQDRIRAMVIAQETYRKILGKIVIPNFERQVSGMPQLRSYSGSSGKN